MEYNNLIQSSGNFKDEKISKEHLAKLLWNDNVT